jgi:hypothetical protein
MRSALLGVSGQVLIGGVVGMVFVVIAVTYKIKAVNIF